MRWYAWLAAGTGACVCVALVALQSLAVLDEHSSLAVPVALLLLGTVGVLASLSPLWIVSVWDAGANHERSRASAVPASLAGSLAALWFWSELAHAGKDAFPALGAYWQALVASASVATGLAAAAVFGAARERAPRVVRAGKALLARTRGLGRRLAHTSGAVLDHPASPWLALALFFGIALLRQDIPKPLPLDAGQYLYVGQVLVDGGTPYVDAANNKGPALYLLFAALSLAADGSSTLVHASVLPFTALASLAVGAYVARFVGRGAGLVAGLSLACFVGPEAIGGSVNTEYYGLAGMAGAWWIATRRGALSAVVAGVLTALTVLLNIWFVFVIPFVAFELWRGERGGAAATRFAQAGVGVLAVSAPMLGWLALEGAIPAMAQQIGDSVASSTRTLQTGEQTDTAPRVNSSLPLLLDLPYPPAWVLGVGGSILALGDRRLRLVAMPALMWVLVVWLRVRLSSYSYEHYFLPATIGLAAGVGLLAGWIYRHRTAVGLAFAAGLIALTAASILTLDEDQDDSFRPDPLRSRRTPSVLARPVASFVRRHTDENDTLFVANNRAQVYWLSERRAPTRFFDAFSWQLRPENRPVLIRELSRNPPAAVASLPAKSERLVPRYVKALFECHSYREAYRIDTARVWLRAGADSPSANRFPEPSRVCTRGRGAFVQR